MAKDLACYQSSPHERVHSMHLEGAEGYHFVRLKDIPDVAGDGATLDGATDDLRAAFDEFVTAQP